MNKIFKNILGFALLAMVGGGISSCSDSYMEEVNTDSSKPAFINPNAQLTTGLLQTYGDFGLMDTYRSYITGFTQYFMGGWNVANYAGSNYSYNSEEAKLWNRIYAVGVKNMVDAIANSADKPNVNAALRIHYVYIMSVLTDVYGDIPCLEAGKGFTEGISYPKYDTQEEIYNWFFTELETCIEQLGTGNDVLSGDVTSMEKSTDAWKRYANSLRMRFAMRISDVNPVKAKQEFEKALHADCGYISTPAQDAYIKYSDSPYTLYEGSDDLDFRSNALGEMLYGQDPTSPTFVCATLYDQLKNTNDPRLWRFCRHYLNTKRSQSYADKEWNIDVTGEVEAYCATAEGADQNAANHIGMPWWEEWVSCPSDMSKIPTLEKMVNDYPEAGFNQNNFNNRMMRPFLNIAFEESACPGILFTAAEAEFLLAEAEYLGWHNEGTVENHYKEGVRNSMRMINNLYSISDVRFPDGTIVSGKISEEEMDDFLAANPLGANPKEAINTQAWILHMMNPAEGWANARRSDYPVLDHRTNYHFNVDGFIYNDTNYDTPVRLHYPALEVNYNKDNYLEAVNRYAANGKEDWHARLWWDKYPQHFSYK